MLQRGPKKLLHLFVTTWSQIYEPVFKEQTPFDAKLIFIMLMGSFNMYSRNQAQLQVEKSPTLPLKKLLLSCRCFPFFYKKCTVRFSMKISVKTDFGEPNIYIMSCT